jgi:hypothetical protein
MNVINAAPGYIKRRATYRTDAEMRSFFYRKIMAIIKVLLIFGVLLYPSASVVADAEQEFAEKFNKLTQEFHNKVGALNASKPSTAPSDGGNKEGWPDKNWYKAWNDKILKVVPKDDPVRQYKVASMEEACKFQNNCLGQEGVSSEGPCGALFNPKANDMIMYFSVMCWGRSNGADYPDLVKLSKSKENSRKSCEKTCGTWQNGGCACPGSTKLTEIHYGGPYCDVIPGTPASSVPKC